MQIHWGLRVSSVAAALGKRHATVRREENLALAMKGQGMGGEWAGKMKLRWKERWQVLKWKHGLGLSDIKERGLEHYPRCDIPEAEAHGEKEGTRQWWIDGVFWDGKAKVCQKARGVWRRTTEGSDLQKEAGKQWICGSRTKTSYEGKKDGVEGYEGGDEEINFLMYDSLDEGGKG